MHIPGLARLRHTLRRATNRATAGVVVLLYHRVTTLPSDPQWLTVAPGLFDRQVAMLRATWPILSIPDLAAALRRRALPRRAVAITFDDGYADNLTHALPILERHAAPATFYVASGLVGGTAEIFSDDLDRLLLSPSTASGTLTVVGRSWHLPPLPARVSPNWNVLKNPAPTERHAAYRDLCAIAAPLDAAARAALLDAVRAWAGETPIGRASHRFVTPDQLRALAASQVATIGAHTVTHPRLAALPPDEQRHEIAQSKHDLESIVGQPVTTFAYPFGGPADQSADTVAAVRAAGFDSACVNHGGSVRHRQDPHRLNRILARDWPPEELHRRIREAFLD